MLMCRRSGRHKVPPLRFASVGMTSLEIASGVNPRTGGCSLVSVRLVESVGSLRDLGQISWLSGMAEAMPFPSNRGLGLRMIDSVFDGHGFGVDGFLAGYAF